MRLTCIYQTIVCAPCIFQSYFRPENQNQRKKRSVSLARASNNPWSQIVRNMAAKGNSEIEFNGDNFVTSFYVAL